MLQLLSHLNIMFIFELLGFGCPVDQISLVLTCKALYEQRKKFMVVSEYRLLAPKSRSSLAINHVELSLSMIERPEFKIKENITSLKFLWAFSKPLPATFIIPNHITRLDLAGLINQDISVGFIPPNVEYLDMSGIRFKSSIELGMIPDSVVNLVLPYQYNIALKPNVIPKNVKKLEFGFFYNHQLKQDIIPEGVEEIQFGNDFNQPLEYLPPNLKRLKLGSFNLPIAAGALPSSLEALTFGYHFNQPIPIGSLPSSLKILIFGCNFNQPIIPSGSLPKGIEKLEFGYNFNHPIPRDAIPSSVKHLTIGNTFSHKLYYNSIPGNVEYLSIGQSFKHKLFVEPAVIGQHRTATQPPQIRTLIPNSLKVLAFGPSLLVQNKFLSIPHFISNFTLLLNQPLQMRRLSHRSVLVFNESLMRGFILENNKLDEQFLAKLNKLSRYPKLSLLPL